MGAGVALAFLNRWGAGFMGPHDPAGLGMIVALGTLTLGLLIAIALMFGVWVVARPAIGPFGISLALSFLASAIVAVIPQLREVRTDVKGR